MKKINIIDSMLFLLVILAVIYMIGKIFGFNDLPKGSILFITIPYVTLVFLKLNHGKKYK
jgi:hypothetical protein